MRIRACSHHHFFKWAPTRALRPGFAVGGAATVDVSLMSVFEPVILTRLSAPVKSILKILVTA